METLKLIMAGIILTISFCVLGWEMIRDYRGWLSRDRRAGELLRAVLTGEQYNQLLRRGYLDIKSPRNQERIYRVPRGPGLVRVIGQVKPKASLCLQPLVRVPDADIVVMHKLMIEADEETYPQTANSFALI